MSRLTQAAGQFAAEHAYRHSLRADGRESLAHMLVFPGQGLAGFIYPTRRARGPAKARATLFGPALAEPVHEQIEADVPDSMDFDDWQTGPLRMAVTDPHRTVELSWQGDRIRFDGRFEALHPPYAFSLHPQGNPAYYGDDRTEQHGRVTAQLSVDGNEHEVEGFLIRDHSWGPRIWGLNQHYKWCHATTASCSVHFFEMQSFGRRQLRGFIWRDGIMEHVSQVECEYRFDDQMMHKTLQASVTDAAGRQLELDCRAYANIQLEFDPKVYLNEAALELSIDGEAGTGWCEFCWNQDYLTFAREYVIEYGQPQA